MAPPPVTLPPPPEYPGLIPSSQNKPISRFFTRRYGVMVIALLELMACIAAMTVYIYALAAEPSWYPFLVPIPSDLCNATNVVHGVMYIIILICTMEIILALSLFEGARQKNLGKVQFWLSSMLTYLTLVTIVILGMDLGGIRCPTMNSAAFINIFLRFLEILMVYAWMEQENLLRKLRASRLDRCSRHQGLSSLTICTMASTEGHPQQQQHHVIMERDIIGREADDDDDENTPPPSYSSTIPSRNIPHYPPPPQADILTENETNN